MTSQLVDMVDKPPPDGRAKVHRQRLPLAALPDLLSQAEAADVLLVHVTTLRKWRHAGYGPPVVMVGKYPRYDRAALATWIRKQTSGGVA